MEAGGADEGLGAFAEGSRVRHEIADAFGFSVGERGAQERGIPPVPVLAIRPVAF